MCSNHIIPTKPRLNLMDKTTKNLLLSLKNCSAIKQNEFYCDYSAKNIKLLSTLYSHGFIQSFIFLNKNNQIKIFLRSIDGKSSFGFLKFVSTTLNAKSITFRELSFLFNKRFLLFLNTNLGVFTIDQCKKFKIGGKMLFFC